MELKVGTIRSLWRYPVRSMRGEELESVGITSRGIVGDRCYGVVDVDEGCCAESSYQPGRWAALLRGVAAFDSEPSAGAAPPPIKIQFDDGSEMSSNDPAISAWLSDQLGHAASLLRDEDAGGASIAGGVAEIRGAAQTLEPDAASAGTPARGYDRAPVHLVTTASLLAASGIHAEGQFVPARFRPNIVLDCEAGIDGFIESDWVGRTLAVGEELRLEISEPCERCSVPTLPQGDLVRDRKILSTITKHNATNMGVYARVAEPGSVRLGDLVVLLD